MTMARGLSPRAEAERRSPAGREPWLEEADFDDPRRGSGTGQRALVALVVVLGLLVALVGVALWTGRDEGGSAIDVPRGEIPLIRSPGPWKVPAEGPDTEGEPVEGQGQVLFPAGEGLEPEAALDPARLPEEPVPPGPPTDLLPEGFATEPAAPIATPPPAKGATPPPAPRGEVPGRPPTSPPARATPAAPSAPPAPAAPSEPPATDPSLAAAPAGLVSDGTIQLGAFSNETRARAHWRELSGRFPALAVFRPEIASVERDGRTLWRLRARGPDAVAVCDRLRMAGETCAAVRASAAP